MQIRKLFLSLQLHDIKVCSKRSVNDPMNIENFQDTHCLSDKHDHVNSDLMFTSTNKRTKFTSIKKLNFLTIRLNIDDD